MMEYEKCKNCPYSAWYYGYCGGIILTCRKNDGCDNYPRPYIEQREKLRRC